MLLGEYELNDMLEGQFEDPFTMYFTMGLLAFLAIIGRYTELITSYIMRIIIYIVRYYHNVELQYIFTYKFQFGYGEPCCCYHCF
jgi:hypothetical protein